MECCSDQGQSKTGVLWIENKLEPNKAACTGSFTIITMQADLKLKLYLNQWLSITLNDVAYFQHHQSKATLSGYLVQNSRQLVQNWTKRVSFKYNRDRHWAVFIHYKYKVILLCHFKLLYFCVYWCSHTQLFPHDIYFPFDTFISLHTFRRALIKER